MGGDSLRPYLKMQNLFVRDISKDVPPPVVKAHLDKLCPLGKVVLPIDHRDQNSHISQAYLNYNSQDESKRVLDKHRFSVSFNGVPAKLMYAPLDRDRVFGPYSLKFQVVIKNLSEEVDVRALFDFFSRYGEIYQCKTDRDVYDQYYGQVTYLDEDSVAAAVAGANHTRWSSSVILVEPHHKAYLARAASSVPAASPNTSSTQDFPSLNGNGSSAPAAAAAATQRSSSGGGVQQVPVPLQQQQQQGEQQSLFSGPVNFALQAMAGSSGGGSSSAAPAPSAAPVPNGLLPAPFAVHSATPPPAVAASSTSSVGGVFSSSQDAPVAAPHTTSHLLSGGGAGGGLGLTGLRLAAASGPAGVNSAVGAPVAAPPAPVAAPSPDGGVLPPRLGTSQLLQLLDRRRADVAAASSLAPAAAAPEPAVAAVAPAHAPAASSGLAVAARGAGVNGVSGGGRGLLKSLAARLEAVEAGLEASLSCPIMHEVFRDPVVAADGRTYERAAITAWLQSQDTSPMTNEVLPNRMLHPNNLIKALVQELL